MRSLTIRCACWTAWTLAASPLAVGESGVAAPGEAVLRVTSEGLVLEVPEKEPRLFESARDLVEAVGTLEGRFLVEAHDAGEDGVILPSGTPRKTTRIAAGEIPVLELVRFLADARGVPVLHEAEDPTFRGVVTVPKEIPEADEAVAKAILEANRITVRDRTLPSGERVVLLSGPGRAKSASTDETDVPYPLVVVEGAGGRRRTVRSGTSPKGDRRVARGPGPDAVSWEGVVLEPVPEVVLAHVPLLPGEGILIREVDEETARRFPEIDGLRRSDILTHVNEIAVRRVEDLPGSVSVLEPGAAIRYRVLRKGFTRILTTRKD